ncbi:MAG: anthranilate synthase component I family protein [Planctomycetaceae bacterium]
MTRTSQPRVQTCGPEIASTNGAPLVEEMHPVPDVGDALRALSDLPGVVLFESRLQREPVGRYSFLAADPFEFVQIGRVRLGDDPFERVRDLCARFAVETVPDLPPFQGGAAGVLSYELGHAWEDWPRARFDEFQLPDMAVGLYDWVIAWDHQRDRAWTVSQGFPETDPAKRTARAAERLREVHRRLSNPQFSGPPPLPRVPVPHGAPQHPLPNIDPLTSDFSRDGYLRTAERVIEHIHAGDIFQANLSQRLLAPQRCTSLELYDRLRTHNPAPFAGYFAPATFRSSASWRSRASHQWAVISASPERFLRVENGEVETRPIKGTRKRREGREADLFTRDELRESGKDRAENVMIVDLLRNDLSRVCAPGSIRVPSLCGVETYETVQHLVSEIRGELEPPNDAWDLLRATFPGGSITGAPKVRAMEIIADLEPTARGPYCGSLFYAGFDGSFDSSILIRTFLCRGGWIQCPVGGGIVAQSDPVAEYEETLHKAEGMLRALGHKSGGL